MRSDKHLVYNQISSCLTNLSLKKCIDIQYKDDNWHSSVTEIKNLLNDKNLNDYDSLVAQIFLCRAYSLDARIAQALEIINSSGGHIEDCRPASERSPSRNSKEPWESSTARDGCPASRPGPHHRRRRPNHRPSPELCG